MKQILNARNNKSRLVRCTFNFEVLSINSVVHNVNKDVTFNLFTLKFGILNRYRLVTRLTSIPNSIFMNLNVQLCKGKKEVIHDRFIGKIKLGHCFNLQLYNSFDSIACELTTDQMVSNTIPLPKPFFIAKLFSAILVTKDVKNSIIIHLTSNFTSNETHTSADL